ncbi:glycosyltransferase family 2 protein [Leuconostoc falkenbergense]|uniref:glycosyltransferase family 2 protein n=1 Tax=Leuconostoc falkenbergense TaxID=2766470 RepID=UPI0028AF76F4|nr:glycosyltransferase family 2 protein [Leuconostoc falkenbergense]
MAELKQLTIAVTTYNSEKYIKFYDEFLKTWSFGKLEIIFVDDASTDRTQQEIQKLENKYLNSHIIKHIFHAENTGISKSVNDALEVATGDFFLQNDGDDFLLVDGIREMLDIMSNTDFDMVQAGVQTIENNQLYQKNVTEFNNIRSDTLLKKILIGENVIFQPGSRMIRLSSVQRLIPSGKIYPSKEGQNWQILIPLCLHGKVKYIKNSSVSITVRSDSHSRSERSLNELVERTHEFLNIWINSVVDLSNHERRIMVQIMNDMLLNLAYRFGNRHLAVTSFVRGSKSFKSSVKLLITLFGGRRSEG